MSGLQGLMATPGVRGAVVYETGGRVVESQLRPPYDDEFLWHALSGIVPAWDAFSSVEEGELSGFTILGDTGGLVARHIAPFDVLVLTESTVNLNLLNVALNVVLLHLSKLPASHGEPAESGTLRTVQALASELGAQSQKGPLHASTFSTTGADRDLVIPPDAVERSQILRLLELYRGYMGPAAKMVLKQELSGLGVTSWTLRRSQYQDLVTRLAKRIPSSERRVAFHDAVAKVS